MPLAAGALLGPYQLVAEIGSGGMGHVFRALDTRLDRAVAIKIVSPGGWSDADLRARFHREARAISSLSHPNICSLFDVGEVTVDEVTVPYLVMEYLEGETLRVQIEKDKLSARKALAFGAQIAAGLAAAHEKGLIHRDLKPENLFVTPEGQVKILDFGLTKISAPFAENGNTRPGDVVGTAHYMSPEQVRGRPLDHRSDIFSFGIVLYEMLTGRLPFRARSAVETMHAILREEPAALAEVRPDLPESVEMLVQRCLEKEPANRFLSTRDLSFALDATSRTLGSAPGRSKRRSKRTLAIPRGGRMWIVGLVLLGFLAAVLVSLLDKPDLEPPRLRTLTYSGRDGSPAVSADGRLLAFVSTRDGRSRVWLEQFAEGTEVPVTSGPYDSSPRFAPDASQLLFTRAANGGFALYRVPTLGGEPRKVLENAFDGDWSPDGRRVAFIRNRAEKQARLSTVCIASLDGGEVREIAATADEDLAAPRWSPDGSFIAVVQRPHSTGSGSVLVVDVASGEKRVLSREEPHGLLSGVAWLRNSDAVIYAELEALTSGTLQRRSGGAAIVLHDLRGDARVLLRNAHAAADTIAIASPGRIVFSEDVTRQNLQEVALGGAGEERWLSRGTSMDRQPSYAADGQRIVFTSDRGGNVDVWELTLASGGLRRLTDHDAVDWDPHLAADGSLFWSSNRGGHFEVWRAGADGLTPRQVTRDGVDAENPSLPASGEWVAYDSSNPKTDGAWRVPAAGGEPRIILAGETMHPAASADGEYVVYQRPEAAGSSALDVVSVRDGRVQTLATGLPGVLRACWAGATHTVVFRDGDTLVAQDFVPEADTSNTRRVLLRFDADATPDTFAISPDGKRAVLAIVNQTSAVMMTEGAPGVE
ncbi:MAG TPA: protein kinase [Thermoanaerobaculia bacterium]|jgi:serine/threonine protein kinase|nr:protein kinase [Thermoanaerobaculia bacterium]